MKNILIFLFLTFSLGIFSQIENPVEWSTSVEKVSNTEFILISKATIEKGWHLYSQDVPEDGPIATTFTFDIAKKNFSLVGKSIEEEGHIVDDPVFEMKIKFFESSATFKQRVKVSPETNVINGFVEFMTCNDSQCSAPTEIDLVFKIKKKNKTDSILTKTDVEKNEEDKGLLTLFLLSFLGGLAALLTPCVFPMIPMTVSFFTKQSKTKAAGIRNAIVYGISIIIIYVVIGLAVSAIFGPDALNALSTNVWFNLSFFFILIFFAASFLGAFELTLPSSWGTKIDAKADKGGFVGIFFMALALAIVSFSCTGPFVGSALVAAATTGERIAPIISMLGFSTAIALPFALFAAFPGWLNSLPKSGGWLNSVKVVLGFLEVAAAFKFLSNADLVSHWGILKVEPLLIIWILTFIGLGLYLFGKIQFPHDSPIKKLSFTRIALGTASIAFAAYMVTGLMYNKEVKALNSLSLLSGFAPPACYSVFYPCDCPQNLSCVKDYEKGIELAQKEDKPILLDFTGYACVNCRKMEENVWPIDKVYEQLKEEYILVSLYVDDKSELPEVQKIEVERANGTKRKLRSVGNKWAHFQAQRFQTNTQPYYVLLSPDGKTILNKPVGYTPNDEDYAEFLRCGVESFQKLKKEKALGLK